jgi:hypothetical protein
MIDTYDGTRDTSRVAYVYDDIDNMNIGTSMNDV